MSGPSLADFHTALLNATGSETAGSPLGDFLNIISNALSENNDREDGFLNSINHPEDSGDSGCVTGKQVESIHEIFNPKKDESKRIRTWQEKLTIVFDLYEQSDSDLASLIDILAKAPNMSETINFKSLIGMMEMFVPNIDIAIRHSIATTFLDVM